MEMKNSALCSGIRLGALGAGFRGDAPGYMAAIWKLLSDSLHFRDLAVLC